MWPQFTGTRTSCWAERGSEIEERPQGAMLQSGDDQEPLTKGRCVLARTNALLGAYFAPGGPISSSFAGSYSRNSPMSRRAIADLGSFALWYQSSRRARKSRDQGTYGS